MSASMWLAVVIAALGTLALRLLPLLWMRRRLHRSTNDGEGSNTLPPWLRLLGPLMIAALFGVSLIPQRQDSVGWCATLVGIGATLIVWRRTRTLGWPVIVGVATFGLVVVAVRIAG
ncbi:AzlD domain-containing protein [Modicisalibacter tunisiensis]|uniref:AzlD domain-containing protein n=1 Tax=Modicisalibacter tunisiensis TaxID=390637 RepID=A0ABS7WVP6_9GAMM|nr:AzlD domain-containing protein [Modicisalibacter tunisiensis]KXS38009.1 MAG: branched-chain amino acid transport [Halomonadaceae bacterium T82-2]MBZ9566249.1 AzlD domain-containing protein [Modicisalibacter tunisiensis]